MAAKSKTAELEQDTRLLLLVDDAPWRWGVALEPVEMSDTHVRAFVVPESPWDRDFLLDMLRPGMKNFVLQVDPADAPGHVRPARLIDRKPQLRGLELAFELL